MFTFRVYFDTEVHPDMVAFADYKGETKEAALSTFEEGRMYLKNGSGGTITHVEKIEVCAMDYDGLSASQKNFVWDLKKRNIIVEFVLKFLVCIWILQCPELITGYCIRGKKARPLLRFAYRQLKTIHNRICQALVFLR